MTRGPCWPLGAKNKTGENPLQAWKALFARKAGNLAARLASMQMGHARANSRMPAHRFRVGFAEVESAHTAANTAP